MWKKIGPKAVRCRAYFQVIRELTGIILISCIGPDIHGYRSCRGSPQAPSQTHRFPRRSVTLLIPTPYLPSRPHVDMDDSELAEAVSLLLIYLTTGNLTFTVTQLAKPVGLVKYATHSPIVPAE